MKFSRTYMVHYYEAGADSRLTISALVHYFEDIAILDSSGRGFDLEYYNRNNCGWMLIKWDITIHDLPLFGDNVQLETWIHSMKSFMSDREFRLLSADGTVLVEARSNWLLVDTVRRRPMKIPADQMERFETVGSAGDFIPIPEPAALDEAAVQYRYPVTAAHSDIDTNGHVNNVRYIGWALDSLPEEFLGSNVPSAVRVQYRKELVPGSSASVLSCVDGTVSRHRICGDGTDFCMLEISWRQ